MSSAPKRRASQRFLDSLIPLFCTQNEKNSVQTASCSFLLLAEVSLNEGERGKNEI